MLNRPREWWVERWQLATRGWADVDVWNLDRVLCARLAGQLRHLAVTGHGWPASAGFADVGEWTLALEAASDALLAWSKSSAEGGEHPAVLGEAQAALRWVADHLGQLWD